MLYNISGEAVQQKFEIGQIETKPPWSWQGLHARVICSARGWHNVGQHFMLDAEPINLQTFLRMHLNVWAGWWSVELFQGYPSHTQVQKVTFSQSFKEKCISEVVRMIIYHFFCMIIFHLSKPYEKPSSSNCVILYFLWGWRGILKLNTLVSESVKLRLLSPLPVRSTSSSNQIANQSLIPFSPIWA